VKGKTALLGDFRSFSFHLDTSTRIIVLGCFLYQRMMVRRWWVTTRTFNKYHIAFFLCDRVHYYPLPFTNMRFHVISILRLSLSLIERLFVFLHIFKGFPLAGSLSRLKRHHPFQNDHFSQSKPITWMCLDDIPIFQLYHISSKEIPLYI